jgi:SPP1 gp7 family putative phage head morphogenesis protein
VRGLNGPDEQLLNQAYSSTCCENHGYQLSGTDNDAWASDMAKMLATEAQQLWKQGAMPKKLNPAITKAYASQFTQALAEGYGVDLATIDYETPDAEMLGNLLTNVYQFSTAKNYSQMVQLTRALVNEEGKLLTWSEFKKAAFQINEAHVLNWMKTEYNTAVASAQMASKWVDIQQSQDALPLLQFDAVMDSHTSDLCRSLEGVIKPVNDPFWSTYYPPNHFACRSTVRQLASGRITPDHEIQHPEKMPALFKTNLAKTGMLWPKDHPYWVGTGDAETKAGLSAQNRDIQQWAKENIRGIDYKLPGGGTAIVSGDAIKELLHKPHEFKQDRNMLLYNLQSVLDKSQLVQTSPEMKGDSMVKQWRYYRFLLNGKSSYLNIRELHDGRMTIYAITDHLK